MPLAFISEPIFENRTDAGRKLAEKLKQYKDGDIVVIGLARGGVPVAFQVAEILNAPLDVISVKKIGMPGQLELAIGAVAEGGAVSLDDGLIMSEHVSRDYIDATMLLKNREIEGECKFFRREAKPHNLRGKTAIIVDDGLATGMTARAAAKAVRLRGATKIVMAFPVCADDSAESLAADAGVEVVCAAIPKHFRAVGVWYRDFRQVEDREVQTYLHESRSFGGFDSDIELDLSICKLSGRLTIPAGAHSIVLFAHGSGSGRHSKRNQSVAANLNRGKIGTLLFDLLTEKEESIDMRTKEYRFDIPLLAARLCAVIDWVRRDERTQKLVIGLFGASTGAAAALIAAVDRAPYVKAVVSRGGRPDLAADVLTSLCEPVLLIVGSRDWDVMRLNELAMTQIRCEKKLHVVPDATHLFEEPGALEEVARVSTEWFGKYLR